jgi:hypothetical protein
MYSINFSTVHSNHLGHDTLSLGKWSLKECVFTIKAQQIIEFLGHHDTSTHNIILRPSDLTHNIILGPLNTVTHSVILGTS